MKRLMSPGWILLHWPLCLCLYLCLSLLPAGLARAANTPDTITVSLEGDVASPGAITMNAGSRINNLLQDHAVSEQAFFLGAAWYRHSLQAEQARLKQGVLFDLRITEQHALLAGNKALAGTARKLQQQVSGMKVTGRLLHELDPAALLGTDINHLLENGDRVVFPARPGHVHVAGATLADCRLDYAALKTVRHYLDQCPANAAADRDRVLVIQPDGRIYHEGIALWNSSNSNPASALAIAPGAIILLAFDLQQLDASTRDINHELACFLATQPLTALPLPEAEQP